jgi:threonine aldolase
LVADLIDLYSDTHTVPTESMRQAMANSDVGDDCMRADPTVNELEHLAAQIIGKEEALYVSSGTQANLASLLAITRQQDEVVLEANSHLFWYEGGGYAAVAGVSLWPLQAERGILSAELIRSSLRSPADHFPRPQLIWVENTHNRGGGSVYPLETLAEIRDLARELGLWVHMDGARVFNAATSLGCDVREITSLVDSVSFCLSKGLGAPVGSMIAGPATFVAEARRKRRLLGGGMRQAGVIAAAGIVALREGPARLADDHANARLLAEALRDVPGLSVATPESNLVFVNIDPSVGTGADIHAELRANGLLVSLYGPQQIRMVTYHQVSRDMIRQAIEIIARTVRKRVPAAV